MPIELHLQYVPEYSKTSRTGGSIFQSDHLPIINACKIQNTIWSLKHGVSLEQATLMRFKSLVEQLTNINYRHSYFDEVFSEHMKRDVVATTSRFICSLNTSSKQECLQLIFVNCSTKDLNLIKVACSRLTPCFRDHIVFCILQALMIGR